MCRARHRRGLRPPPPTYPGLKAGSPGGLAPQGGRSPPGPGLPARPPGGPTGPPLRFPRLARSAPESQSAVWWGGQPPTYRSRGCPPGAFGAFRGPAPSRYARGLRPLASTLPGGRPGPFGPPLAGRHPPAAPLPYGAGRGDEPGRSFIRLRTVCYV